MKNIFTTFILLGFSFLFGQIYEFDKSISINNIPDVVEYRFFNRLTFINENDISYAFFINKENTGVIRDEKKRMIHFIEFSNNQNNPYQFDYKYSIRMVNGAGFDEELYEASKITETEFIIKKFRNRRKKKVDYEFIVNIEKSDYNFLFVPFEKSVENSFQIGNLINKELNSNKKFQVTSFKFKKHKTEMKIFEIDKFTIQLPEKLIMQ